MTSTPSLKIPENFIRERNKATEAEREDHEEIKLRMANSGREKARRQEGGLEGASQVSGRGSNQALR